MCFLIRQLFGMFAVVVLALFVVKLCFYTVACTLFVDCGLLRSHSLLFVCLCFDSMWFVWRFMMLLSLLDLKCFRCIVLVLDLFGLLSCLFVYFADDVLFIVLIVGLCLLSDWLFDFDWFDCKLGVGLLETVGCPFYEVFGCFVCTWLHWFVLFLAVCLNLSFGLWCSTCSRLLLSLWSWLLCLILADKLLAV